MEKIGKKALKILKTKQYGELDTGDIAIALQCDDYSVEESLNSLKDMKLIESYSRSGKVYWRLFEDEHIKKPIDSEIFELEIEPEKKNNPEPEEFIIDAKQKEPVKAFTKPIIPESTIKPAEKSDPETEEFIIDRMQEKSVLIAEPITPGGTSQPAEKNSPESEEFIIKQIPKEPVQASVKPTVPELLIEPEEKNKKEPEAFIIQETSIDPIDAVNDESLVDDNTRVWTLPLTKPLDHETTVDNEKPHEEMTDQTENITPLKRANFSIIGIIIAILVSVSISTGISMFVSMNAINAATSDLQTLKAAVIETNAKHDRQIELLTKKLNFILEKTDPLQKLKPK
jgi:hypothetical protein